MASAAVAGVGSQFLRGDSGSPTEIFTAMAEINRISGPSMNRAFIDVTSLDSTGGYKEYIGGFRDGGDVTLNMNFTLATYNQMKTDFESPFSRNYRIIVNDPGLTTLQFKAFVTDLPLNIVPDDKVSADVTLKITGQVSLTT